MRGLRSRLYQARRRVGIVTALAFLAGYILYARTGVQVNGLPIALLTGLVYAAVVGPAAVATFLFLPALRAMTEAVAVSRLGFACFVYCFPEPGLAIAAAPLLNATLVIGGAAALCWLGRRLLSRAGRDTGITAMAQRCLHWLHDTEDRSSAAGTGRATPLAA